VHTLKKLQSKLLRIGFVFLNQLIMERKKKREVSSSIKTAKEYFLLGNTCHFLKEYTYPGPITVKMGTLFVLNYLLFCESAKIRVKGSSWLQSPSL